jgi:hypothetical protein
MVEKVYDSSAGELQPIEDGDVEELSYTFGVDEDDLGLISLTGGEDANIETLVGEWTAFIKYSEKGSTTMFEETYTLNLTDDGLYELTSEITGGTTNTENGSWEFDKDALELTLDPSNDDAVVYSVEIIGNSFSMSNPDTITLGFVLDKVE